MKAKPQSLRLREIVILFLLIGASHANGQGTLRLDLDELPSGQALAEQYADSGVHFIPRGERPMTAAAPDFLPSGSGTVGRAIEFGIRFDQPITALEFDIAQAHVRINGLPHFPNYHLYAFDCSGLEIGVTRGGGFAEEEWHRVSETYSADSGIMSIHLIGWVSAGENHLQEIFFDNISVTFVPEPGTVTLLALGAAGLFSFMRRKGAGATPGNS